MFKKIFSAIFLVMISFSAIASAATPQNFNWEHIFSNADVTIYIDKNHISAGRPESSAYFRQVYSDSGRKKVIEELTSDGTKLPPEFYNLCEIVSYSYAKNSGGVKYICSTLMEVYDINGNLIDRWTSDYKNWEVVDSDTKAEIMYSAMYER